MTGKKKLPYILICMVLAVCLITGVAVYADEDEPPSPVFSQDISGDQFADAWEAFLNDPDHIQIKNLLDTAGSQIGTGYNRMGWCPETGFTDVSFVIWCLNNAEVASYRVTNREILSTKCRQIRTDIGLPGDLIFFSSNGELVHIGICISETEFIHCGSEVRIDSIDGGNWWSGHVAGFGRICADRQISREE